MDGPDYRVAISIVDDTVGILALAVWLALATGVPANAQQPHTIAIPSPVPAFTPAPLADHTFGEPVTNSYSGDQTTKLNPGSLTKTHVQFDNGVLEPGGARAGIEISNTDANTQYHAITIGSNAEIRVTDNFAAGISTENNQGNLQVLNQGAIAIRTSMQPGIGIRAVMKASPANILLVNKGRIELTGFTQPPSISIGNSGLVLGGLNKAATPHDFTNYSHKVELFNMPGGSLIATGPYNGRINGLKAETGSGHLTRMVNYATGVIRIEGQEARGISAQSLWGASQAHNFGTISMNGRGAVGLHAGNCAPWPVIDNGCHQQLAEIIPNRTSNVPGDVYARNYSGGSITTRPRTVSDIGHRRAYGVYARNSMAGRTFAINEGTIDTEGIASHGVFASGYDVDRDLNDTRYPNIPDYPDTSHHDSVSVINTGTITTNGEAAHGIRAEHHRGGNITVSNSGNIAATSLHSLRAESTHSMGISVAANNDAVPGPGCSTAAGGPVDSAVACADIYRVGEVVVTNKEASELRRELPKPPTSESISSARAVMSRSPTRDTSTPQISAYA